MLTFELPQRQGQGMQRSRSSTAFWHSSWEVAESRLEFTASKAAFCAVRQRIYLIHSVYIHGHIGTAVLQGKMLTFELLQRPGQGMQRSRSSTAFLHSSW